LEIAFATSQLRFLCENAAKAKRELGKSTADALQRRLADLRAASSIQDLVAGAPTRLSDDMELSVQLADSGMLRIRSAHKETPVNPQGNVDWLRVSRIKIMEVRKNG
jgi:hypothetical protein